MPDVQLPPPTIQTEDQFSSRSDKICDIILRRWEIAEDLFTKGNDLDYARATRSFGRSFFTMADTEEKQFLMDIDKTETEEIKVMEDAQKLPPDARDREVKKIQYRYAELRMEILIIMLSQSSIIQKDVIVEFIVPKSLKDCQTIKDMIKAKIKDAKFQVFTGGRGMLKGIRT